jgi:hypothetical protein
MPANLRLSIDITTKVDKLFSGCWMLDAGCWMLDAGELASWRVKIL